MPPLTAWQFAPLASAPLALLAALYLAGLRTVARRHPARPWPWSRALSFLAGLAALAVATQGPDGVYDDVLMTAHMVQHLLLIMVAPPLLIYGRPVTLLLHATRNPWHHRVQRVVRSRTVTGLTWPPLAITLYTAIVLGTHLTPLLFARGWLHDSEHLAYLAVGYLLFLPVVGSEPGHWRLTILGRYLILLAAMPADIITGAVLMLSGPLRRYSAPDVSAAGLIMVAGGEAIMAALAMGLAAGLVRHPAPARPPDRQLTEYNAMLASLDSAADDGRHAG